MGKTVRQLYHYFEPGHYSINLELGASKQDFSGRVTITGKKVGRPTKRITLHQKDLKVSKVRVIKHEKSGDTEITISRVVHHKGYDEVRLHSDSLLYPGSYTIEATFAGAITTPMNGVYPCNFTHKGENKQLLATQFESHHAREVFPCIDEPAAKATFQLSLTNTTGETIISNTPVEREDTQGKRTKTTFEKTPIMSTYLLAFVTGEIEYREKETNRGTTVRTYATPENVAHTDFALDVAVRCLEFYEEYFSIDYPLEKCDLVALPDFASGAMENWGCITFREQTLLVDTEHTTLSTKQYVAMVVAHELAHQWFGNLVTMRWWTDLWLNEGFASWVEYLAVDALFPEWDMWTQFIATEQQQAMRLDTLKHTHPVEVPVNHPDEIRTIFDAISYSKGASLIHMLHDYLGSDDFRTGLQHYLTTHAYNNTDTKDLWQALEDSSNKPVRAFMHNWTSLAGFPLLRANVENDTSVTLSQHRFMTNPDDIAKHPELWPIPLLTDGIAKNTGTFDNAEQNVTYKHEEPFKPNRGQSGFYRTLYNESHAVKLGQYIKKGRFSAPDRIGMLSDMLESAKYGYQDTAEALHWLEYFTEEDNYAVWEIISSWLGSLRLVMDDEDLRETMKPFIRGLVQKQLERLGWDPKDTDTHFDRLLRPIVIGMAAGADESWVVNKCLQLFDDIHDVEDVRPDLRTTPSSKQVKRGLVNPDLRGAVFGTVARTGGSGEFEKLVALHDSSHLSEEKTTLAAAITSFKQPELIDKSLAMIASEHVRLQDVTFWVAYSFMNRHGKKKTWEWLKEHWGWLEENIGSDLGFYRMPLYAARVFSEDAFAKEFTEFFEPRLTPGFDRPYQQALEMLAWQAAWKKRSLRTTKQYFIAKSRQ